MGLWMGKLQWKEYHVVLIHEIKIFKFNLKQRQNLWVFLFILYIYIFNVISLIFVLLYKISTHQAKKEKDYRLICYKTEMRFIKNPQQQEKKMQYDFNSLDNSEHQGL